MEQYWVKSPLSPEEWPWSSCRAHLGLAPQSDWLDVGAVQAHMLARPVVSDADRQAAIARYAELVGAEQAGEPRSGPTGFAASSTWAATISLPACRRRPSPHAWRRRRYRRSSAEPHHAAGPITWQPAAAIATPPCALYIAQGLSRCLTWPVWRACRCHRSAASSRRRSGRGKGRHAPGPLAHRRRCPKVGSPFAFQCGCCRWVRIYSCGMYISRPAE